jgi:hypothetical protein
MDKRPIDSDVVHDKDEKTAKTPIKKTVKTTIKKADKKPIKSEEKPIKNSLFMTI